MTQSGVVVAPRIDRDCWCTPEWLTALLPHVDLDPCSNVRSTVRARRTYAIERGEDGLAEPWFGMVYVNGPYSYLMPWASKLASCYSGVPGVEVSSAGFLVNADSSTTWWRILSFILPLRFDFAKRIRFSPPPGVKPSSNSKPQTLLCDEAFWNACDPALAEHGTLWTRTRARAAIQP